MKRKCKNTVENRKNAIVKLSPILDKDTIRYGLVQLANRDYWWGVVENKLSPAFALARVRGIATRFGAEICVSTTLSGDRFCTVVSVTFSREEIAEDEELTKLFGVTE